MAGIVYPGDFDTFTEPTLPESTSLSSAGTGSRNHIEHHRDLGDAVEALERGAQYRDHDHSGDSTDIHKGNKLQQANTHENPDTDVSTTALHHTLGKGAKQAAPGNHTHDYTSGDIVNKPLVYCTSTTRPSNPSIGMQIWETDTHTARVWDQFPGRSAPKWQLLTNGLLPVCRLRQSAPQQIVPSGSIVEWRTELEDTFNFFNPANSLTAVTVREDGLYHVEAAIQWDPQYAPDQAYVVLQQNGVDTTFRQAQFLRGGGFYNPGFSQTIYVGGKMRFNAGDTLSVRVAYTVPNNLIDLIFSFFDSASQINSRLDLAFIAP